MAFDPVLVGTTANDGTGDPLRTAFTRVNSNFGLAVEGPASVTAGSVAAFNGTTGKLVQQGLGAGTATAPSLAFAADSNTGLFNPGTDTLAFSTNGAERVRIDSSGRVFIGNASDSSGLATSKLQVVDANATGTSVFADITVFTAGGGIGTLNLNRANSNTINTFTSATTGQFSGAVAFRASNGTGFSPVARILSAVEGTVDGTQAPGNLIFQTVGVGSTTLTERVRINSAGNVGIGTTSPNTTLEVAGNIHVSGADRSIFNRSNNALTFGTNNAERMRITSAGNVGIGTTSPNQALHVNGGVQLNRTFFFSGTYAEVLAGQSLLIDITFAGNTMFLIELTVIGFFTGNATYVSHTLHKGFVDSTPNFQDLGNQTLYASRYTAGTIAGVATTTTARITVANGTGNPINFGRAYHIRIMQNRVTDNISIATSVV